MSFDDLYKALWLTMVWHTNDYSEVKLQVNNQIRHLCQSVMMFRPCVPSVLFNDLTALHPKCPSFEDLTRIHIPICTSDPGKLKGSSKSHVRQLLIS